MSDSALPTPPSKSMAHFAELLQKADIQINGSRPWDMQIHDPEAVEAIFAKGSLGLGESYMAGMWDCEQIDAMVTRILSSDLYDQFHNFRTLLFALKSRFFNLQTSRHAWEVGKRHYDAGNDLFERMLDPYMIYTCGYWRQADTLAQAQIDKLDLVCQKLNLKPGMTVLDIGCGWGGFMKYAAEHYGVKAVGLTISKEQVKLGEQRCAGLPVEFRLQDYRDMQGQFDAVVSLGMFEHVGRKNYQVFFQKARECLKPDGLCLLHTIGGLLRNHHPDPWLDKYIFAHGELPTLGQIADAAQNLLVIEDVHNFGADYDTTLMAWHENFTARWHEISDQYDRAFYRMWKYYLLICAGTFRSRTTQLYQVVLSDGVPGGYRRPFA